MKAKIRKLAVNVEETHLEIAARLILSRAKLLP